MIDPKELRIGNILYDDNESVCRVIGMKPFDHSVRCDKLEGCEILIDIFRTNGKIDQGFVCDSNLMNYVPITEEWLNKKLGLIKSSDRIYIHPSTSLL